MDMKEKMPITPVTPVPTTSAAIAAEAHREGPATTDDPAHGAREESALDGEGATLPNLSMLATSWMGVRATAAGAERTFRVLHLISSATYSIGHVGRRSHHLEAEVTEKVGSKRGNDRRVLDDEDSTVRKVGRVRHGRAG